MSSTQVIRTNFFFLLKNFYNNKEKAIILKTDFPKKELSYFVQNSIFTK